MSACPGSSIADPLDPSGLGLLRAVRRRGPRDHRRRSASASPRSSPTTTPWSCAASTKVTADLLRAGKNLKVVGRAGIGVDNVDVAAATELGILVVNAPTANLMSATEHTFALLLSLARRIPVADASMKAGEWNRKLIGVELQGKTLGVIGFGRIGQRVAARARGFEMEILAYDPVPRPRRRPPAGGRAAAARRAAARAPTSSPSTCRSRRETRNLLDRERLSLMKPGALLVNCARGGIVDEEALLEALESGAIGGAALDVFAEEPPRDLRLVRHPKVVATPHLGAQTREAQERISKETAEMVLAALSGSLAVAAVNLPFRPAGGRAEPYHGSRRAPGRAWPACCSAPRRSACRWTSGGSTSRSACRSPWRRSRGCSRRSWARRSTTSTPSASRPSRGIEVVRATHSAPGDYPHLRRRHA